LIKGRGRRGRVETELGRKSLCILALGIFFLPVFGCKSSPESLRTSLIKAVRDDNTEEVRHLIQKGADANSHNPSDGWSALAYAARNGNVEVVQLLLNAGADPNGTVTTGAQTSTVITEKPLVIAEATLGMAQSIPPSRVDAVMSSSNDPALLKSLKDPQAVDRYQKVVDTLAKVTK